MAQSLSDTLRIGYLEQMALEVEAVALRLFEERGMANVTVEEIAGEAGISSRTFYRHFATKDEIFQVRIDQRAKALRTSLAECPVVEEPLHSLREALVGVVATEDEPLRRRWMLLVESSPGLIRAVIGGNHMKVNAAIAEFFAVQLGCSAEDLVPTMLAAATGGVLLAASAQWLFEGGSLAARIGAALEVLERLADRGGLGGEH